MSPTWEQEYFGMIGDVANNYVLTRLGGKWCRTDALTEIA